MLRFPGLLLLCSLVSGCSPSRVSQRIGELARAQGTVDLGAVTDFEWDTAYIFSPYTTNDVICQSVGPSWADCKRSAPIQISEGEYYLVFINRGGFAAQVAHSRANGDFCQATCALQMSRSNSLFKAVSDSTFKHDSHIYLEHQVTARPSLEGEKG
jgi:hypothetical protein